MVVDIRELKTKFWQHKAGSFGEVVCDLEDIGQCYKTILGLTKGDVPLQPNLGADIIQAIGENQDDAERIIKAICFNELPVQEPRGDVLDVEVSSDANGHYKVKIKYKSILDDTDAVAEKEIIL